jgi:hypothetical protein
MSEQHAHGQPAVSPSLSASGIAAIRRRRELEAAYRRARQELSNSIRQLHFALQQVEDHGMSSPGEVFDHRHLPLAGWDEKWAVLGTCLNEQPEIALAVDSALLDLGSGVPAERDAIQVLRDMVRDARAGTSGANALRQAVQECDQDRDLFYLLRRLLDALRQGAHDHFSLAGYRQLLVQYPEQAEEDGIGRAVREAVGRTCPAPADQRLAVLVRKWADPNHWRYVVGRVLYRDLALRHNAPPAAQDAARDTTNALFAEWDEIERLLTAERPEVLGEFRKWGPPIGLLTESEILDRCQSLNGLLAQLLTPTTVHNSPAQSKSEQDAGGPGRSATASGTGGNEGDTPPEPDNVASGGGAAEAEYDPCDREPRTLGELATWAARWAAEFRTGFSGQRSPVVATSAVHEYLARYSIDEWGGNGLDLERIQRLQSRYSRHTGRVGAELATTKLNELAQHFRRHAAAEHDANEELEPRNVPAVHPKAENRDPPPPPRPFVPLTSWNEILAALNEGHDSRVWKNTDQIRSKVRKLNTENNGPIRFKPGKGNQPEVDKAALLEWWNGLRDHYDARNDEENSEAKSADQAVAETHLYGAGGTVIPGIAGAEKKRRKLKEPKG